MLKLDEYAQTQGKRWKGCWVCQHPERDQIEDGARRGISAYTIAKWCAASGEHTPLRTVIERLTKHFARCAGK